VKCWDLAVILLHAGEQIKISCPAYLANGGAEMYSQIDSKKIPPNTPLTYNLEILEC
jgi:FKBP-type peptidyl-prolyl cis-trans isomerase